MNRQSNPRQVWRTAQAIWVVGLAFTLVIWAELPLTVHPVLAKAGPRPLTYIFPALGLAEIGYILWLKRIMHRRALGARSVDELIRRVGALSLATVALAISPSIMGIPLYMVTSSWPALGVMCLIGLLALVVARPRLDEWREVLPSTLPD